MTNLSICLTRAGNKWKITLTYLGEFIVDTGYGFSTSMAALQYASTAFDRRWQ